MRLNREKLLTMWNADDQPACESGMQLAEAFLLNCAEAINRFGEEEPADRITEITASYTAMVEHGDLCDDCKEANLSEQVNTNELAESDDLPSVDETSPDYKAGFQAGTDLLPCDESKSAAWQRGWADAEE